MNRRTFLPGLLGALALAVVSPFAAASDEDAVETVDAAYVCMVNDAAYDHEQVRVDIDGKAYYGCCEMCKARLAKEESLRSAVDPVSGKEVDKATAVIGADAYKRVYYFENEENLKKFNESAKKAKKK